MFLFRDPIQLVCDSMRRQIFSRAFYGWLAYCRHLRTVRTHLSGLVLPVIISPEGAESGVTVEKWNEMCKGGTITDCQELFRLTYFGGVSHSIRIQVKDFLVLKCFIITVI